MKVTFRDTTKTVMFQELEPGEPFRLGDRDYEKAEWPGQDRVRANALRLRTGRLVRIEDAIVVVPLEGECVLRPKE